jgi:hypothetical protein
MTRFVWTINGQMIHIANVDAERALCGVEVGYEASALNVIRWHDHVCRRCATTAEKMNGNAGNV